MAQGSDRRLDPQLCIAAGVAVAAAGLLARPPWRHLVAGMGAALAGVGVARLVQAGWGDRARPVPEHWSHYGDRALSVDEKLHGALQDSFPASDPLAVSRGRTGTQPVH